MGLFCEMFGHKPERAFGGGHFYRITAPYHDGIGRSHRDLWSKCERCDDNFRCGRTIDPETAEVLKK